MITIKHEKFLHIIKHHKINPKGIQQEQQE